MPLDKLTPYMKDLVRFNTVGFMATVCDDGTPNLSPKGTSVVLDDRHIVFGDIRSPGTVHNIRQRPAMEVNYIDLFARKGFRAKGLAYYIPRHDPGFESLSALMSAWPELIAKMNGVIKLEILSAAMVSSPIYDTGAIEKELRDKWRRYFSENQP